MLNLIRLCMTVVSLLAICLVQSEAASFLENLFDDKPAAVAPTPAAPAQPSTATIASGLREALAIGTQNAVRTVGKTDGYFGNSLIKILMPEKLRTIADTLSALGFKKDVDALVLSMNRAAENAAPKAETIFGDAIRQMSIDDARKILEGSDTAATDYFKSKTTTKLTEAFKPAIAKNLDEVGGIRAYRNLLSKAEAIPFLNKESLDIDAYVTNKSLEGLFTIVAQEEKKIRTNPAARTTDLLRTVFGK